MIRTTGLNKSVGPQVDSITKHTSDAVVANLPQIESLKRALRRFRNKGETIERLPPPGCMINWEIPERLKYFLLFDSKANFGEHRIQLFSTERDLRKYAKCDDTFSDGTWHTPKITNNPKTKTQVS